MDKTETPLLIAFVGIGPLLLVREIYSAPPVLIIGLVAIFFLIAVFLLGIVFVERIIKPLIRTLKKSITGKEYPPEAAPNYTRDYKHTVAPTRWEGEPTLPILQFATTYTLGDDRYDPSRSIETPKGQFLGECGVGMVSASKQGQSRLAPAFEVWLFDKNDVQTRTHVLFSEYAAQDEEVRPRLAKENPSTLAEPGLIVSLQTATLQLHAKVIEATYLPHDQRFRCYFERLTVEIAVWQI